MPIYEYRCVGCSEVTSVLVLAPGDADSVRCQACGRAHVRRVPSRFACLKTESQRVRELDRGSMGDEGFYRDRRNVGLWAKKRAAALGAPLGDRFDESLERARTARGVEDLVGESLDGNG